MHFELNFHDWFSVFSAVLIAISYTAREIVWLRVLTVMACMVDILAYVFIRVGQPISMASSMSFLYLTVNAYYLFQAWQENSGPRLDADAATLHRLTFSNFSKGELRQVLKLGQWIQINANERIFNQNEPIDAVVVVVDGELRIKRDNVVVGRVAVGGIAGEMSYLTGQPASAHVEVEKPTRLFVLPHKSLQHLSLTKPALHGQVLYVLAAEVVRKLNITNTQLAVKEASNV